MNSVKNKYMVLQLNEISIWVTFLVKRNLVRQDYINYCMGHGTIETDKVKNTDKS